MYKIIIQGEQYIVKKYKCINPYKKQKINNNNKHQYATSKNPIKIIYDLSDHKINILTSNNLPKSLNNKNLTINKTPIKWALMNINFVINY